ncbi:MAG: chromosomal replication initiator protein DnaA, partial [Planctomycetota bacterium]|nr:chromosomal replication initiator protein DnaA [Planctomycetota bacterium]
EKPGQAYNPMFIHGDVGLGKTHLLQAVCMRILERNPSATILYIPCEAFVTRFMESVQAGEMTQFRHYFRDVDMLVIDDVHFLAERDRTQEEFFHTFNSLYQSNRQIILSSDAPPDEIPHLEKRLVSRFKWGLVAQIDPPDYETRVAIVKQKGRVRGVTVPDDVACLVAARVASNIRELEGALTKIQMHAHVAEREMDVAIAREALGVEEAATGGSNVTIQTIVDAVTGFYDVSLSSLQSKRRQRSIALPRQVCLYLARKYTRYSLEEIGGYFGGRDHTTVLHAVRTITTQRDNDGSMDRALQALETKLHGS